MKIRKKLESKRFAALVIFTSIQLIWIFIFELMNFINHKEINLLHIAGCFGALAIIKGVYDWSETKRPHGFQPDGKQIIDEDEL